MLIACGGDAQDVDFNTNYLEELLDAGVESISSITLTGGEPTLALGIIKKIRKILKKRKIDVGSFYLVTNGKKITTEFVREMMEWYLFCSDNEVTQVCWSNDQFHEDQDERGLKLLSTLRFVERKYGSSEKLDLESVLAEGRAESWGGNQRPNYRDGRTLNIQVWDNDNQEQFTIDDDFLLTATGLIAGDCDMSYERIEEENFCHVSEFKERLRLEVQKVVEDEMAT